MGRAETRLQLLKIRIRGGEVDGLEGAGPRRETRMPTQVPRKRIGNRRREVAEQAVENPAQSPRGETSRLAVDRHDSSRVNPIRIVAENLELRVLELGIGPPAGGDPDFAEDHDPASLLQDVLEVGLVVPETAELPGFVRQPDL